MPAPPRGRGQAGLTLVELVVAVSLVGVLMGALGPTLVGVVRASTTATSDSRAADDLRAATALLERDVRSASCVLAPAPGGTGTSLSVVTRVGDGTAVAVTYAVSGSDLVRTVAGAPGAVVAGNVSAAATSFARGVLGTGAVTATLAVDRTDGRATRTATVTAAPRVESGC